MAAQNLGELCDTFLYSASSGNQWAMGTNYVGGVLAHPDKGSEFEMKMGNLKHIFRIPGLRELITPTAFEDLNSKGYDILLIELNSQIIGHTAYHVHEDNSLHIFSVKVNPHHQKRGLARYMVEQVLNQSRKENIPAIRVGGGKSEEMNRIHANFAKRSDELKIEALEGNWIKLLY